MANIRKELNDILKKNDISEEEFCKMIGISHNSFKVLTVSTKEPPKWIKSFMLAYGLKK